MTHRPPGSLGRSVAEEYIGLALPTVLVVAGSILGALGALEFSNAYLTVADGAGRCGQGCSFRSKLDVWMAGGHGNKNRLALKVMLLAFPSARFGCARRPLKSLFTVDIDTAAIRDPGAPGGPRGHEMTAAA